MYDCIEAIDAAYSILKESATEREHLTTKGTE